ncbi:hypothetical protein E2320_014400 [Naja naja]|nr:hypothetical protein E2320_014400 [Naja naja]
MKRGKLSDSPSDTSRPPRTPKRTHECSECGKSFARRSLLLTHRKDHVGRGSSEGLEALFEITKGVFFRRWAGRVKADKMAVRLCHPGQPKWGEEVALGAPLEMGCGEEVEEEGCRRVQGPWFPAATRGGSHACQRRGGKPVARVYRKLPPRGEMGNYRFQEVPPLGEGRKMRGRGGAS